MTTGSSNGQKGLVKLVPEDSEAKEIYVGMELTVRGELADMWLVERHDGTQSYIPKECFELLIKVSIRDCIDDCMAKVDDTIQIADAQGNEYMTEKLQEIKERLNDLTMEVEE